MIFHHDTRSFRILGKAAVLLALASTALAQGRIEESHPLSVSFRGTWHRMYNMGNSGFTAMTSTEPGAQAILTFRGTGVRWIGFRDEWSGIAAVFLDGAFLTTIDTYATPAAYRAQSFEFRGFPFGTHTLVIEALDVHSAASGGAWVSVDAFDVTTGDPTTWTPPSWAGAIRDEQDYTSVAYVGTWFANDQPANSGGTAVLALDNGARATFSFDGTGVRWIGYRDEWSGIGRVYLDGALVAVVDAYVPTSAAQAVLFTTSGLARGAHTLAVEATHERNEAAKQRWVWVDAFDVLP
jgi:hypothetical protein